MYQLNVTDYDGNPVDLTDEEVQDEIKLVKDSPQIFREWIEEEIVPMYEKGYRLAHLCLSDDFVWVESDIVEHDLVRYLADNFRNEYYQDLAKLDPVKDPKHYYTEDNIEHIFTRDEVLDDTVFNPENYSYALDGFHSGFMFDGQGKWYVLESFNPHINGSKIAKFVSKEQLEI